MRILVITRDHVSDVVGGTRVYAHEVNRYLAARGHEVTHLCYASTANDERTVDGVRLVKVRRLQRSGLLSLIARMPRIRALISRTYAAVRPDVVLVHSAEVFQYLVAGPIPKRDIVMFVHSVHSHEIVFDLKKTLAGSAPVSTKAAAVLRAMGYAPATYLLEAFALRAATRKITMSEYDRAEVRTYHGSRVASRLVRIAIGVDLRFYRPAPEKAALRAKMGFPVDTVVFVVFRRLAPRMGLENLIDGFAEAARGRKALLLIGGKGELRSALERRINAHGLEQSCRLLGFVDAAAKLNYLQAADFFVLPTEELEGFGIVILEALACNLPVLGTPAGAIPETLSQLGPEYLARDASPSALADLLAWAMENRARLRGSFEFREFVEKNFDWRQIAAQVEQVLQGDGSSSPPPVKAAAL